MSWKIPAFAAVVLAAMLHPAVAQQGNISLPVKEAKTALTLALGIEGYDCEYKDDGSGNKTCPAGWHCTGMGICVPPAKIREFQSRLPTLLGRRR